MVRAGSPAGRPDAISIYVVQILQISIPLVVLSVLGWMLFVIGFAIYNNSDA